MLEFPFGVLNILMVCTVLHSSSIIIYTNMYVANMPRPQSGRNAAEARQKRGRSALSAAEARQKRGRSVAEARQKRRWQKRRRQKRQEGAFTNQRFAMAMGSLARARIAQVIMSFKIYAVY